MQFTKLRLAGFKSFVDPTELLIEPGLTGIVGPNGCGKSNLVEALQWVMGETSARRLRGGDMDDVIFGGTSTRPARNIASVGVWLDNTGRTAPVALNDRTEIEVERRIDRGKGSTYRVNGREQRARDVQILFADAASGAGSTALVGQGRIGWLINAKPAERRVLLEEAAGISGLHARRHEAELKLSAAETNLARLSDIGQTLVVQIERLKKQAKQAERYRRLSDQIRTAEAMVLHRHWLDRAARRVAAQAQLEIAERLVAETAAALEAAGRAREAAQDILPGLRQSASDRVQQAERLIGQLHALEAEERRIGQLIRDNQQRLRQIDQDIGRERQLANEAANALQRLDAERGGLAARLDGESGEQDKAAALVRAAKAALVQAEAALSQATSLAAAHEAERLALARRLAGIEERRVRLRRQMTEAVARARELELLAVSETKLATAAQEIADAEAAQAAARAAAEQAEAELRAAQAAESAARPPLAEAERRAVTLKAEINALTGIVSAGLVKGFAPVLDRISVEPGLETALGAALGDDLLAALDPKAAIHWADLPDTADVADVLPHGAVPLAASVNAPDLLARRLARIGLVPDVATGERLQSRLSPGQRLVTRDGAVWRWDGLRVAAGAPTAAAARLAQRNRLAGLQAGRAAIEADLAEAQRAVQAAAKALAQAQAAERGQRDALRLTGQRIAAARQAQAGLLQQHAQAQARQQAAAELRQRLAAELAEADQQASEAEAEKTGLADAAADARAVERLRAEVTRLRQEETQHQRELDRLVREAAGCRARIQAIDAEQRSWRDRAGQAAGHATLLDERRAALAAEIDAMTDRPAALADERAALNRALEDEREAGSAAATALRAAEAEAQAAERAQQAAGTAHGAAREQRVRAEAGFEQASEALTAAAARIREVFDCAAESLAEQAAIPAEPGAEAVSDLESRLDRLKRERESIGPVNLMAETEMAEMSAELAMIRTESEDLTAAIARLRQGIQQINREGRERLTAAFNIVNEHFQALFVRLFGGGRAYLELTQNEADPLAAGIEIMASPPGKRLQVLSLLSGGERALTALALLFAVFLTNPAPICVLDEVDAPLDDANVERFCQMVREIGDRTGTRFLVITHHRVSMARMDRLYGVTMTEQGISQLVSVELSVADRLRQTA